MTTMIKKEKVIAAIATLLFFGSLIGTAFYSEKSKYLQQGLNNEKIKSEEMLSEKLALEKDLSRLEVQLVIMKGKSGRMDARIMRLEDELTQKQAEVNKMKITASNTASLQRKINEMKTAKQVLESEISTLNNQLLSFRAENEQLSKAIASLQSENKQLAENLAIVSSLTGNNYRIENYKAKRERLTVLARQTKKMVVSFEIPQNVVSNVSFKILTPEGKTVSDKEEGISYEMLDAGDLYASVDGKNIEVAKRIEMTYKPKEKLKAGLYTIEILNNNKTVGGCQVRLR